MPSGWPSRCARGCAAWAATLPLVVPAAGADPLARPAPPAGGPAPAPATAPAQVRPAVDRRLPRWADVCQLTVVDGKLSLRSDLTTEMVRGLQPGMPLEELPGATTVAIKYRRFTVQNVRTVGNDQVTLTVEGSRTELRLELNVAGDGRNQGVVFTQAGTDIGRRLGRGGDLRLTVFGYGPGETIIAEADDLPGLRRGSPHAANRYLRPLLRQLGADLFQVDPAAARQVLLGGGDGPTTSATQPAGQGSPLTAPADPGVMTTVRQLVTELDAPEYARRSAAADRLAQLGPPGLTAVAQVDRARLSPQQNLALDLLIATSNPLPDEEVLRLRTDLHFLLDCLYSPQESIRSAAADRLVRLTRQGSKRFEEPLALDPTADVEKLGAAIEKLRDELAPPPAK